MWDLEEKMLENVEVFCHNSIKITGSKTIYIDPFKIENDYHDADYVFSTHTHYDHFSEEDIARILTVLNERKAVSGEEKQSMEERNSRRKLQGVVVSDKMQQTIVVLVSTYKNHSLYGKRVKYSKKYKAHDEQEIASIGDTVEIMETRPLSADKHFRLVKVVKKAEIA